MSYIPKEWKNEELPALNATNLNHIEEGIKEAHVNIEEKFELLKKLYTYSTEEQIIGTWIDGKPLYRKVISTTETLIGGTNLAIRHDVIDWDKMWVDLGNSYYYEENRKRSLPLEQTYYTTTDSVDKTHVYIEGDYVYLVSYGGWSENWEKVITLNYTKTTDIVEEVTNE